MQASGFRRLTLLLILLAGASGAVAQETELPQADSVDGPARTAPVVIDGRTLFSLRGITSYPADRRAADVAGRIRTLARDRSFDPATLVITDEPLGSRIGSGSRSVVRVTDLDAEAEGAPRSLFANICLGQVKKAIVDYRSIRTREAMVSAAWRVALATLLAALGFALVLRLFRALFRWTQQRVAERVKAVTVRSFEVLRAERIRAVLDGVLQLARGITVLVIAFVYVRFVLALLPWTHGAASEIDSWILGPIGVLGTEFVAKLPDLAFLFVLFIVVRYALRLVQLFFTAVGRGDVTIENFDPEWAQPTYNILRVAVIAFALVVAYPYIPGSSTGAFKGVTLFMGVILSLGSSSAISNVVAGYTMIYRRAFREGDVVKIGSVTGLVTQVRVQVTHLRTPKNEEIIVPNSTIMGTEVTNYSSLAKSAGLVLHTNVGIGYDTPWRQVEAILLEAANRTPGLLKEPAPFVLATTLGEFAITYQLNAYCSDPKGMIRLYDELHRKMLDAFNEHGVQIMTPAYEGDPETPKIVPRARWQWPPP